MNDCSEGDLCTSFTCSAHGRYNRLYASLNEELQAALDRVQELEVENRTLRSLTEVYPTGEWH